MSVIYNIRGTNGSGKTTLARAFLPPCVTGDYQGGPVDLNYYPSPTKRDPNRQLRAEGFMSIQLEGRVGVIGRYNTACGGMDTMPSFDVCQGAIQFMVHRLKADHVIAEGILASTVYGSWGLFAQKAKDYGHTFAFCYIDTPLDVCIDRIKQRQALAGSEKPIKWELVEDKFRAIKSTREKALAAGCVVYDIPHATAETALRGIMTGSTHHRVL